MTLVAPFRRESPAVLLAILVALAFTGACAARPRMCVTPSDCGAKAACVAGRCQPNDGIPAINAVASGNQPFLVRRIIIVPDDVAYVRRGDRASGGALPSLFTLGRAADGDALLFMHFSVPLPRDANIVEAYVLLTRSDAVDSDPAPISLHAARIVEPWDSRSISWASQPRTEEVRAPATSVLPGGRTRVRLDVRELVRGWRAHEKNDHGIAILAENTSATGMTFAFTPVAPHADIPPAPAFSGITAAAVAAATDPRGSASSLGAPNPSAGREGRVESDHVEQIEFPKLELYIK